MEKTLKSTATNYGLYLGAGLALLTVLAYALNLDLFTKVWYGLSILAVIIITGIISTLGAKKLNDGFITFKNAFTAYFITVVIGVAISAFVGIVIFNFIDSEAAVTLQEKIIEAQIERQESFNVPDEAIAKAVEKMEGQGNMFSIGNSLQSILWQILGFSIVGLIVAAAMKKNKPETE